MGAEQSASGAPSIAQGLTPLVTGLQDGVLPSSLVSTAVVVLPNIHFRVGGLVTLTGRLFRPAGTLGFILRQTISDRAQPLVFQVPDSRWAGAGSNVSVNFFWSLDSTQSPATTRADIRDVLPRNPLPSILQAQDGELDVNAFSDDATIVLPLWASFALDQRLWLSAEGTDSRGAARLQLLDGDSPPTAGMSETLQVDLSRSWLETLLSGSSLTVQWHGGSKDSDFSQATLFGTQEVTMVTDSKEGELDFGASHVLEASNCFFVRGQPPRNPPASALYTRVASGGSAPYRYRVLDTRVAQVDEFTGRVKARSNGVMRVIAIDQAGNSTFYELTIVGIQQVERRDDCFWGEPNSADREWQRRALNAQQMRLFWQTYHNSEGPVATALGWPLKDYWTTTEVQGNANAWAYELNGQRLPLVWELDRVCYRGRRLPAVVMVDG